MKNGTHQLVPVWTNEAIPKEKIFELLNKLKAIKVEAPVDIGQVILKNVFGTDIDVVTSFKVDKITV